MLLYFFTKRGEDFLKANILASFQLCPDAVDCNQSEVFFNFDFEVLEKPRYSCSEESVNISNDATSSAENSTADPSACLWF